MTSSRSLSDIGHSTATHDAPASALFSAQKNPQRIPANTPPVFLRLRSCICRRLLRLITNGNVGQALRALIVLLLAITMNVASAISLLCAEDSSRIPMQLTQMSQAPRKNPFLEGSHMVRPSSREREAVYQLLALKPRPKALKDADVEYLKELRNKSAWYAFDQRMVHELWAKVNGREWNDAR